MSPSHLESGRRSLLSLALCSLGDPMAPPIDQMVDIYSVVLGHKIWHGTLHVECFVCQPSRLRMDNWRDVYRPWVMPPLPISKKIIYRRNMYLGQKKSKIAGSAILSMVSCCFMFIPTPAGTQTVKPGIHNWKYRCRKVRKKLPGEARSWWNTPRYAQNMKTRPNTWK